VQLFLCGQPQRSGPAKVVRQSVVHIELAALGNNFFELTGYRPKKAHNAWPGICDLSNIWQYLAVIIGLES
jgi:hypothetical protein